MMKGVFEWISRLSYSIYLSHMSIILKSFLPETILFYPPDSTTVLFVWKAIAFNSMVVLMWCFGVYVCVEKPVTEWLAAWTTTTKSSKHSANTQTIKQH